MSPLLLGLLTCCRYMKGHKLHGGAGLRYFPRNKLEYTSWADIIGNQPPPCAEEEATQVQQCCSIATPLLVIRTAYWCSSAVVSTFCPGVSIEWLSITLTFLPSSCSACLACR